MVIDAADALQLWVCLEQYVKLDKIVINQVGKPVIY